MFFLFYVPALTEDELFQPEGEIFREAISLEMLSGMDMSFSSSLMMEPGDSKITLFLAVFI